MSEWKEDKKKVFIIGDSFAQDLTNAIHEFKGGVVIISHNREFTNAVTTEKWIMEKGRLRREGESIEKEDENKKDELEINNEVVYDSMGNEIKIEKKELLSEKDKKRKIKLLQKKLKEGKKKNTLTQDEIFQIEDEIEELKN